MFSIENEWLIDSKQDTLVTRLFPRERNLDLTQSKRKRKNHARKQGDETMETAQGKNCHTEANKNTADFKTIENSKISNNTESTGKLKGTDKEPTREKNRNRKRKASDQHTHAALGKLPDTERLQNAKTKRENKNSKSSTINDDREIDKSIDGVTEKPKRVLGVELEKDADTKMQKGEREKIRNEGTIEENKSRKKETSIIKDSLRFPGKKQQKASSYSKNSFRDHSDAQIECNQKIKNISSTNISSPGPRENERKDFKKNKNKTRELKSEIQTKIKHTEFENSETKNRQNIRTNQNGKANIQCESVASVTEFDEKHSKGSKRNVVREKSIKRKHNTPPEKPIFTGANSIKLPYEYLPGNSDDESNFNSDLQQRLGAKLDKKYSEKNRPESLKENSVRNASTEIKNKHKKNEVIANGNGFTNIERNSLDSSSIKLSNQKMEDSKLCVNSSHNDIDNQYSIASSSMKDVTIDSSVPKNVSKFQERLNRKLKGGQFRWINEQLYTSDSKEAVRLFKEQPSLFNIYHSGFEAQVKHWPENPVDLMTLYLMERPSSLVVADFGCGQAKLAQTIPNKVHSFDLVAVNEHVTACDMKHVPLPKSCIDVAVFSLALMGTNVTEFILEANRVLKVSGMLKIAEVKSRFHSIDRFIEDVQSLGFEFVQKDISNKMFVMLDFQKQKDALRSKKAVKINLRPCVYKRR